MLESSSVSSDSFDHIANSKCTAEEKQKPTIFYSLLMFDNQNCDKKYLKFIKRNLIEF